MTEPTNEQLNHDIATKVMGWTGKKCGSCGGEYWVDGEGKIVVESICQGGPGCLDFVESHDDFMLAVEALTPKQQADLWLRVCDSIGLIDDTGALSKTIASVFTAPLRTKCLALLAAVEDSQ